MNIKFTVFCPLCGNTDVDEKHLRGLMINRKLSIASDIVMFGNQISQLNPKKDQASILLLEQRLEKLRKELSELEE